MVSEPDHLGCRTGHSAGSDRCAHALESTLLTPAELARLIVPIGTTAVISDSHEVANVMGVRGIDMLAAACEGLPLDLFFMASSCVPATAWEDAGAALGPRGELALVPPPGARSG